MNDMDLQLLHEAVRAMRRRADVFGRGKFGRSKFRHDQYLNTDRHTRPANWALALSGGGIRAATFALGVLQVLAHPSDKAVNGLPPRAKTACKLLGGLLPQFDYVSSVSGGGFTAGCMQTLYVARQDEPQLAAAAVNKHLAEEPPPRVQEGAAISPMAWLRENGRYLAPSGAGDMAYAFGFGARNWLGIHCVIGAPILFVTAALALIAHIIAFFVPSLDPQWWWLPLAVCVAWVLPSAGAYWMTRDVPDAAQIAEIPKERIVPVLLIGLLTLSVGLPLWLDQELNLPWRPITAFVDAFGRYSLWPLYLSVCGTVLLASVAWARAVRGGGPTAKDKGQLAVALTHVCAKGMRIVGLLLLFGLVLEVAHELLMTHEPHPILVSGGGAGILAIAYRALMKVAPLLRGEGSSLGKARGMQRRSVGAALSVLGFLLLLGVVVFWTAAAEWLMVGGGPEPWIGIEARHQTSYQALAGVTLASAGTLAVLSGLFVFVVGRWESILNTSSYCHFYSSRLTRAYLGAANPQRTTAGSSSPPKSGVARFVDGDSITYARYYAKPAAPLHLINATLNQTVDAAEQLIQRDRKGRPFTVLPPLGEERAPDTVSIAIGDKFVRVSGAGAKLSIGDWLAISGAAVSTGMGRQTSAGAAICVTLANARIGRWWDAGHDSDSPLRTWFPTYAYLRDELLARFQGDHHRLLYLTDGGHFENTGAYELLRRAKNRDTAVRFVLLCDCGADKEYRYDDLANLIRLARVDFQLEVSVDEEAAGRTPLSRVFGTPATMGAADPGHLDTRCAILLNVRDAGVIVARIVLIKPRLIACASSDLLAYYRNNPVFPQQTTGDQFFDDEQWESYRKLGVECCRAVLELGPDLWNKVL